ncbi:TerC family protein [Ornithinimicrobium pekingense]|uniref:Tellurium resistance protein TerC n=1 Tax=Ornithinimicrobium pekingense TaxID=384677 RepID=A0ABQ2FEX3_9MICO|nr:TerC family protein [Ornithinimicrobium pekingense]GGK80854.1 tellurium resistance protein TerC [Ornithinimicrobium pekingense]
MTPVPLAATRAAEPTASVADPTLWLLTIGAVVALLVVDMILTRRPHEVGMREALGWSAFYLALPLAFGVWIWNAFGSQTGLEYYTGYLVEKSLSVDNLFVFIIILSAFAVPRHLQQRVLLIGIVGALVLRGIFIALGAALIANFAVTFLVFGLILLATAWKVLRDARSDSHGVDVATLPVVRLTRRFMPVTDDYRGSRLTVLEGGRRALTPLALVALAILGTDIVFAVDSVPAVYGITGDPYLVFVTNAFALLGLRALYFVLEGALGKLRHLGYGLSLILAFIGVKLVLHWAHGIWPGVPTVPTVASLVVIVGILAATVLTSVLADRRATRRRSVEAGTEPTQEEATAQEAVAEELSPDRRPAGSDRPR